MADIYIWGMYKFDISGLAGETVSLAEFNWYLESENIVAPQQIGVPCWRAISANGTDDQDWLTSDGVAKLYDNICEYTRSNSSFLDRIVFGSGASIGYYAWDITTGLQAAIDDGDSNFTCVLSRDTTQGSGTKTKASATATLGPLTRGGTNNQNVNFRTSENASDNPFIDVTLVAAGGIFDNSIAIRIGV